MSILENQALIQNLVNQIEADLAGDIDIVSLAADSHLSPWHFQRLFKSWVGDTLGGYVRGRRLTRAAELLLTTGLGIIDIAFEVGFQSHEAFTRSFKAYFQLSPKRFRQQRPAVRLQDKPLLSAELMQHLAEEVQREPHIFMRPALDVVGLTCQIPSPFTHPESHCETMQPTWMQLLARQQEIPQRLHDTYLGMSISASGQFSEDQLTFLAGIPVQQLTQVPTGMLHFHFPAQLVASFEVATVDTDTVSKTMDYVYGYWLPNSAYQRGQGHDYEYFVGVDGFSSPDLTSQYVLPLQPKI